MILNAHNNRSNKIPRLPDLPTSTKKRKGGKGSIKDKRNFSHGHANIQCKKRTYFYVAFCWFIIIQYLFRRSLIVCENCQFGIPTLCKDMR